MTPHSRSPGSHSGARGQDKHSSPPAVVLVAGRDRWPHRPRTPPPSHHRPRPRTTRRPPRRRAPPLDARRLDSRAHITRQLRGSGPGHLWIPTEPGRPRHGAAAVKPDINRADVRTLHAAHRALVFQLLGRPVRPCAFCPATEHDADHPSAGSRRCFGSVTGRGRLGKGPYVVSI